MTVAIACPTNKSDVFGDLLGKAINAMILALVAWFYVQLARFSAYCEENRATHCQRLREEQIRRQWARARIRGINGHGEAVKVKAPVERERVFTHDELERGDLVWIKDLKTNKVVDGIVVRRQKDSGWSEFRKGQVSWALMDDSYEILARTRTFK